VAVVVGLGIALFAAWWLYDLGKLRGVHELAALRTEHAMLEKRHKRLLDEASGLRDQVAILDRSSQIDRQAALDVKDDLGQLEEELQAAREEIEFYRGIVAPGDVRGQCGRRVPL
jgi:predicted  nucleic acid-binding Zn-ribbon protein